jgi:hypothetical protein
MLLIDLVVIDAEFDSEDHSSISRNCGWERPETI